MPERKEDEFTHNGLNPYSAPIANNTSTFKLARNGNAWWLLSWLVNIRPIFFGIYGPLFSTPGYSNFLYGLPARFGIQVLLVEVAISFVCFITLLKKKQFSKALLSGGVWMWIIVFTCVTIKQDYLFAK